jgi:hypothetical protein
MSSRPDAITVEVRCINLPATCRGAPIYLGIQNGREVEGIVPAAAGKAVFNPEFRLGEVDASPNFLGPFAQGPRDERFFYLSWGTGKTGATFQMFRRLKVHLSHVTLKHIESAARRKKPLRVTIDMMDRCGMALCASARHDHPAVSWELQ